MDGPLVKWERFRYNRGRITGRAHAATGKNTGNWKRQHGFGHAGFALSKTWRDPHGQRIYDGARGQGG
jgi:hypothetical protein